MLKGVIVLKEVNINSKSEGLHPFLYVGKGEYIKIRLEGDNPFENNALLEYDGMRVLAEGEYNDNKTFIASSVIDEASVVSSTATPATEPVLLKETLEEEPKTDDNL